MATRPSDTGSVRTAEKTEGGIARSQLIAYLDEYLESAGCPDMAPNGLQVEGRETIRRLTTGVSACRELFERAIRAGSDAVLVHHGIFWDGASPVLTGIQRRRVHPLLAAEVNLIAYHLPLDRHPEVGNNALAARALGLEDLEPFGSYKSIHVGYRGRFRRPISLDDLVGRAEALYAQPPLVLGGGPTEIRGLGIVSGAAEKSLWEAIALGLDAFITGEVSEWVMNVAREAGVHFLAAGHYATERLGVRELGRHLERKFGVTAEFIDVPNPV